MGETDGLERCGEDQRAMALARLPHARGGRAEEAHLAVDAFTHRARQPANLRAQRTVAGDAPRPAVEGLTARAPCDDPVAHVVRVFGEGHAPPDANRGQPERGGARVRFGGRRGYAPRFEPQARAVAEPNLGGLGRVRETLRDGRLTIPSEGLKALLKDGQLGGLQEDARRQKA